MSSRLWLVLVLILAQFGSIAHAFEHHGDEFHTDDVCAMCLVATHLDSAVAQTPWSLEATVAATLADHPFSVTSHRFDSSPYPARGPPEAPR